MKNDILPAGEIPFVKEAYHIAMAELAERHAEARENARLREAVVNAIMDLVAAGQQDPSALARYAVARSHYVPVTLSSRVSRR